MNKLKHRIQNESALRTVLELQSTTVVSEAMAVLQGTYQEYQRARRLVRGSVISFFVLAILVNLLGQFESLSKIVWLFVLAFLGYLIMMIRQIIPTSLAVREFARRVDELLFVPAAQTVGFANVSVVSRVPLSTIRPTQNSGESKLRFMKRWLHWYQDSMQQTDEPILARLNASELITESFNTTAVDTVCSGVVHGLPVTVAELKVQQVSGSGKNRTVRDIFHGYFVECTLNRTLSGKTFVSAEQDITGFGNLSFFNKNVRETLFEWNEFENLLHVATTNEVEARYILTPDFMSDLYDWWKGKPERIRISFIADRMFLLYPDKRVRIVGTIDQLDEKAMVEHLYTIARPLMYVVHLVEDVRS